MTNRRCSIEGCDEPHHCRGLCKPHYRRDYYERNKARENANFRTYRAANLHAEKARFAAYSEHRWGAERRERDAARVAAQAAPEKLCPRCGTTKPKDDFYTDPRRADGLYSWCKQCFRAHCREADAMRPTRERSPEHKAAALARLRQWRIDNPERARQVAREAQARRRAPDGVKVDYDEILAEHGMVCHICDGDIARDDLQFDHVFPLSKGGPHVPENIRPSHADCNRRKHARILQGVG